MLITEVPMAVNNRRFIEHRATFLVVNDTRRRTNVTRTYYAQRDARFVNHRVHVRSPAADATFMIYEHCHLIAASPSVAMHRASI